MNKSPTSENFYQNMVQQNHVLPNLTQKWYDLRIFTKTWYSKTMFCQTLLKNGTAVAVLSVLMVPPMHKTKGSN